MTVSDEDYAVFLAVKNSLLIEYPNDPLYKNLTYQQYKNMVEEK